MRKEAAGIYVTIGAIEAFAGVLAFTITNIYRFEVAGLNAFQLVIVGSAMEAAVFLAEIPTGIVADAYSRRLSVIIGHLGMGLGLLLEASWPSFAGVLVAQVFWGIAYTFTSGATTAWVTTEMGDPDRSALSTLFFRAGRWGSAGSLLAVPMSFALATRNLRLPIILGGVIEVGLGLFLVRAMVEMAFHPEPAVAKVGARWREFAGSARRAVGIIRSSRVLWPLAIATLVAGGAGEAYDRFNEKHFIDDIGVPQWGGHGALFWLGVLFSFSSLIGIVVPFVVQRLDPAGTPIRLRRWLVSLMVAQILGLVVFGITGTFLVAAVGVVVIERVRSVRNTLVGAWIVPLTPKGQRATVLSTMGQFDALGQIGVGPSFGVIGRLWSVPAALVASAGLMAPSVALVAMAGKTSADAGSQPTG
jgi:DHA3 family tetracycline resistance protein-like MFS transporter